MKKGHNDKVHFNAKRVFNKLDKTTVTSPLLLSVMIFGFSFVALAYAQPAPAANNTTTNLGTGTNLTTSSNTTAPTAGNSTNNTSSTTAANNTESPTSAIMDQINAARSAINNNHVSVAMGHIQLAERFLDELGGGNATATASIPTTTPSANSTNSTNATQ